MTYLFLTLPPPSFFSPLLPPPLSSSPCFFSSLSSFLSPLLSSPFHPCKSKLPLPVEVHLAVLVKKKVCRKCFTFYMSTFCLNQVAFFSFSCSLYVIILSKSFLYLAEPVQLFFSPFSSCFPLLPVSQISYQSS